MLKALIAAVALAVFARGASAQSLLPDPANDIILEDIFGRTLNGVGVTLVDWDGFIANPAIQLFVRAPLSATFPAYVTVSATEPRLYFNKSSSFGAGGPGKNFSIPDSSSLGPFYISIFPDRDGLDEDYTLTITMQQKTLTVNVHVIDQDRGLPAPFRVTADFSQDQTGLYNDAAKRALFQQAADDFAYFIDDLALDPVPTGAESTFIWNPDGFVSGRFVSNAQSYLGFLLYSYGIHSSALRSGGEPSRTAFQTSGGVPLSIRRSGGVEMETQGNFNTLGWFLTAGESDWWKATNFGNEQNDFYSITHHEIGHALFFNPGYPMFTRSGTLSSPELIAYHGAALNIDSFDHFNGEIDDASRKGAFGYEYYGEVPSGRWLPTKLDLLAAKAIGYKVRNLSPFIAAAITNSVNACALVQEPFGTTWMATGGIPFYDWSTVAGALPDGLTLNAFTGAISGTPTRTGMFGFTVRLRDYDPRSNGLTATGSIVVAEAGALSGDVNGDGQVMVADVFYLINNLFAGGPPPIGQGDANRDGQVTVADVFYLINYLFAGGQTPC